jgi:hypothetical protein
MRLARDDTSGNPPGVRIPRWLKPWWAWLATLLLSTWGLVTRGLDFSGAGAGALTAVSMMGVGAAVVALVVYAWVVIRNRQRGLPLDGNGESRAEGKPNSPAYFLLPAALFVVGVWQALVPGRLPFGVACLVLALGVGVGVVLKTRAAKGPRS